MLFLLEKYWYYENNNTGRHLYLCKRTNRLSDILSIREVIASLIYKMQNTIDFCDYQYVYDHHKEIAGCCCRAFTSENRELVTAYDLLEEYGLTQQDDVYEIIIENAVRYGMDHDAVRQYMDIQTMIDYLITNRDRHQGNIGFLRDPETLQIVSAAPVFDSGSSKEMEFEKPLSVDHTTVNGLYNTETECLFHVKMVDLIDCDKLLSKEQIYSEVARSTSLSIDRKKQISSLYAEKVDFLKKLQKQNR